VIAFVWIAVFADFARTLVRRAPSAEARG